MASGARPSLELVVEADTEPAELVAALGTVYDVVGDRPKTAEWVYLDTHDGRLSAAGLTLELALQPAGGLSLTSVKDGARLGAGRLLGPRRDRVFASDLPTGAIRDRLESVLDMRALMPQARVRSERQPMRVLDREAKTVARLVFERPSVVRPGVSPRQLTPRLTLLGVLGYDRAFDRAATTLLARRGVRRAEAPLVNEAIRAAGGSPGGVSSKIGVRLLGHMRADDATRALCRRLAEMVEVNLPGTVADIDTEFLHDLRVAIRRTRSVLREMKGVLPSDHAGAARVDLKWVQEITGPTRDLDVQLLAWDGTLNGLPAWAATDLQPLHDLLAQRRQHAFVAMRRELLGRRYAPAWQRWRDLLYQPLDGAVSADRPNAHRPVGRVAGDRIIAVYRGMVRMGTAIDDASPPAALHELRKRGKELRYLLELYGQLWPADVVAPMVSAMKGLQDVLGRYQDDEVQANYLRALAPDLAAAAGGMDAVIALGIVIAGLTEDQRVARDSFAKRFAPFASAPTRALVRATFKEPA